MTIKTDKKLKQAAQDVAAEIGVPLGTLMNSFLRQLVRSRGVTFSSEYIPTPELAADLALAQRELASGGLKPVTLDELIKDLTS